MRIRSAAFEVSIWISVAIGAALPACSNPASSTGERTAGNSREGDRATREQALAIQPIRIESDDPTLARLTVTPDSIGFYELAWQVQRSRVFLYEVRSKLDYDGWYLGIPEDQVHREQPLADLLQAIVETHDAQWLGVRNSIGTHILFYRPGPDEEVDALRNSLASPDPILRQTAIRDCRIMHDLRIVDIVAPHYQNSQSAPNSDEQPLARELLRQNIGVPSAALLLPERAAMSLLKYEYQNGDRSDAVAGLGTVGGEEAMRLLRQAVNEDDKEIRLAAVHALRYLRSPAAGEALLATASDIDAEVRQAVAEAFSWITGAQAAKALEALIADEKIEVRMSAATALGWQGSAGVELLERTLHDSDANVRRVTTAALGQVGNRRAVTLLSSALHDPDYLVREGGAMALGQLGGAPAMTELEKAVHNESRDIRWAAAGGLGMTNGSESLRLLRILIDDAEVDVRKRAVYNLRIFAESQSLPLLAYATEKDDMPQVQGAAAAALGEIGGERAVEMLAELFDRNSRSDDWSVRRDIAYAFGSIGSDGAVRELQRILEQEQPGEEDDERAASLILAIRRGAIDALGGCANPKAVTLLAGELRHADRMVRHDAINALARLGGGEARRLLIRHSELTPSDREAVRRALSDWLADDEEVREFLGYNE